MSATATSRAGGWWHGGLGARAGAGRRGVGAAVWRADGVVVFALLLDTAIAVVDAVTAVVLINLVVFGPLVAAVRSTARGTALVAAYALGLAVYEGVPHGIFGTPDHVVRCAAIAVTGALAVWGAQLRERSEATRRRAALLAEAGALLSASLGYEATLRTVARLVVPGLADWCSVDVPGPGGAIRNVATAHVDSDSMEPAEGLRRRHPPTGGQGRAGVARVVRGGRAELYPTIPDELLAAMARDADHLAMLRRAGTTSAMIVPMAARGRTLGAITFIAAESGRRYDREALEVAQELARRCAVAVDNARLYGERSRVAQTLQQSLLPARLPEVPAMEVAARFHAVGEDVEVGGDFFDLFAAAGGTWGAVIGDVSGKGAEAAAVTALARYTLRAVASHDGRPAAVLGALNDAMLGSEHAPERFCTAAYARVLGEPPDRRVKIASGGHPLPLLVTPEGTVEPVGEHGMLLGVSRRPPLVESEVKLEPGDKLVFYTDGVIEARCPDGGMLGVEGLSELLASCGDLDTVATGERIHRAVIEACGDPRDDIAILVLRAATAGRPRGNEGLVRSGAVGQHRALNLRLRGGPRAPSAARAALDGLGERSLDPGAAHDARLLISELITNSVRHAGATAADSIGVDAELSPDRLRVEVADHGPGFSPTPGLPPPEQTYGRGLFVVDHLADRWGTDDEGRRIWFELDRRSDSGP